VRDTWSAHQTNTILGLVCLDIVRSFLWGRRVTTRYDVCHDKDLCGVRWRAGRPRRSFRRSRVRRWEYRVRLAIRSAAPLSFRAELEDPLLDVTQPILAEKDLVPDEESRCSEGPARHRTLRVGEELVLDLAGLD